MLATGEVRALAVPVDTELTGVAWFPDDLHLLVSAVSKTGDSLQVMSTLGGSPAELVKSASRGAVSPDGHTIAYFHDITHERRELWLMDADGQHARKLVDFDGLAGLGPLVWSPDGRGLAFADSADGGTPRLRTVSVDGRLGAPLADGSDLRDATGGLSCAWLADGRIVYARENQDNSDLWATQVDATTGALKGEPALVARSVGNIRAFTPPTIWAICSPAESSSEPP